MTTAIDPEYEQAWIREARLDTRAFERFYNAYFPRVYAYVAYRVDSTQSSEDITAEVFLKVVQALGQGRFEWRHEGSFAAWLFRIAHNAVTDHHRRGRGADEPLNIDDMLLLPGAEISPEAGLLAKERAARLRALVGTLSPRRQEIVTLKFFGELANHEIAGVLGLDERAVASHLCRALRDLHGRASDI